MVGGGASARGARGAGARRPPGAGGLGWLCAAGSVRLALWGSVRLGVCGWLCGALCTSTNRGGGVVTVPLSLRCALRACGWHYSALIVAAMLFTSIFSALIM